MTGEMIPDFRLPASTGNTLELASFRGKVPLVLVFLDESAAAHHDLLVEIDRRLKDFGDQRAQILPVMRLVARDARRLAEEGELSVPVLADASGAMARDYGVESSDGSRPAAVVADKEGRVVRRFDPLPDGDPSEIVEALLHAVSAVGSRYLEPGGDDSAFLARVAEEARVPSAEAPALVNEVLAALAPSLGPEARSVISDIAPEGIAVPEPAGTDRDNGVEGVVESSEEEAAVASGRGVEHTRVVAEALARRADPDQLRRLIDSIDDEDVLALFESVRGEMTRG